MSAYLLRSMADKPQHIGHADRAVLHNLVVKPKPLDTFYVSAHQQ